MLLITLAPMGSMLRSVAIATLFTLSGIVSAGPGDLPAPRVNVECPRSSAFVKISVVSDHRIGRISFELVDQNGHTLYREEGKALTGELVRRLDKGVFPRGAHTLQVRTKEFAVSRSFTVE